MTDQTASFPLRDRRPAGQVDRALSHLPWPAVLYFLTVVIPIGFPLGPLTMTTLRAVLLVMIVPLTIRLLAGRYGRLIAPDYLFAGFLIWSTFIIALKNPDRVIEFGGSTGIEFFGGYLMGRAYIRTPEAFEALTRLMILFLALTLPFAIYEGLTSRALLLDALRALPGLQPTSADNGSELRAGLYRVQLTFSQQIHYGLFASLAFSLTYVGLKDRLSNSRRYVASAVIAVCIYLSLSSGAFLALVLQLMLISWQGVFAKEQRRWHILVGLLAVAYVVIDLLSNRTPVSVFLGYATFSPHTAFYRTLIFDYGMDNVWANPVFGLGLNDWVRPSFMIASVDNFWLLAAMRFGILGFLLLAGGYLGGLVQVIRRDFSTDARLRQMRLAWVITFLGMAFTLSTVALWTNVYSFVFFMFASGMWLITAQPAGAPAALPGPPGRRATATTRRQTGPQTAGAQPAGVQPAGAQPAATPAAAPGEPAAGPQGPRYTRFPPSDPGRPPRRTDRPVPGT